MKIDTTIAGASFREGGMAIITALPLFTRYSLEREPTNPYDKNAVKVLVKDYQYGRRKPRAYHLGYIPRKWSGTVSAALKNNQLHVWATKQDNNWGTVSISWENVSKDPLA